MLPIAYSVAGGILHRDIRSYKREADPSVEDALSRLAGLLGRFLPRHERCLASRCGVSAFDLVTTVPSQHPSRGVRHPLERIVGELVPATAERHQPLLRRTDHVARKRSFDRRRFEAVTSLGDARVLLVDDMWTSGASAQSAASALREAGAATVGAVVIARHLGQRFSGLEQALDAVAVPLQFSACALCAAEAGDRRTDDAEGGCAA